VWALTKNMRRATLIAANVGRFFGFLFIFFGVWQMFGGKFTGGLCIAFIGWFLDNAASAQLHSVVFQGLLAGADFWWKRPFTAERDHEEIGFGER
jgi:hypothetical protein